ncbi:UNVERIFIED_ORG: hypothetical protein J2R85_000844 [Bradyrhizobium japonicum]
MRDDRESKWTGTERAKQQRMRGNVRIRRRHTPLLPAKRLAFLARCSERDLGAQRRRGQQGQQRQEREDVEEPHELPESNTDNEGQTNGNESSWADFLRCHRHSLVAATEFCTDAWQFVAVQGSALSSFGTTQLKY